jgi:HPt (histidine-containing phosphotransfer) domain-containing protein
MSNADKTGPAPAPRRSAIATRLLPKFIGHRARDLETLRDALAQRDFETVGRIGHNMRGNGHSYGFPEIGLLGERLEAAADTRNEPAIGEQLAALEAWLAQQQTPETSRDEGGRTSGA